jgi:hypothetical protein
MFAVVTIMSLLIPADITVSRSALINSNNCTAVIKQVSNLGNWKNWHPLFAQQGNIRFTNPSAGELQRCEILYGNKKAVLAITASTDSTVNFVLRAQGEDDIQNQVLITPIAGQQNIKAEWRAYHHLQWYPWQKFYGIFIDKLTGPSYEQGLQGLKEYFEKG